MQHRQQSSKQFHPQHSNEPTNVATVDAAYPNPPRLKSPFQPVSNSTSITPTTSCASMTRSDMI
ncbi:hypothetical protein PM082_012971 [Marasmius tenuissimus]|nr:hypothetical protein PM082_012971 [Marasmius tenuissimus]